MADVLDQILPAGLLCLLLDSFSKSELESLIRVKTLNFPPSIILFTLTSVPKIDVVYYYC